MITADNQFILDRMNSVAQKVKLGSEMAKTKNVLKCKYSFAKQGGAVGDISLLTDLNDPNSLAKIPANAIIVRVLIDVITAVTSGASATVAFKAQSAADLLGATAKASLGIGLVDGVPVNTAATSIKLTAERTIKATVAVAALTAGVINVFVEYVISD